MKLPHLIIIFILIIMPIVIVSSQYIDTQIDIMKTEEIYDSRLLNSTYDAVKSFQINTTNTMYFTPENRVNNMEAAANTFFYSLATSFKYSGTKADTMKEYVPAILLTMYDGYYIYSPFTNTIPNEDTSNVESEYDANKTLRGLKPYVSYTCNYNYNNATYMITYSLDNYVVIDEFRDGEHKVYEGYLIDGITESGTTYTYKGIDFKPDDTEVLSEFLGEEYGNKIYYYTVEDGTKYYYKGNNTQGSQTPADDDQIVYINDSGTFSTQANDYKNNKGKFRYYYDKIFKNDSAYQYYKEAYNFTNTVKEMLSGLRKDHIDSTSPTYSMADFTDVGDIFGGTNSIEDPNSNFNRHRVEVIRAVITTNLKTAISGFNKYTSSTEEFIMPKISESDWELLENNVCMATFFQGLRIKNKTYNSYTVVANSLNKEFVSENDIYILKADTTFTRANDKSLLDTGEIQPKNDTFRYYPGVLRINIEPRKDANGKYYNPISINKATPYLESYTTLAGNLNSLDTQTMNQYIGNLDNDGAQGALKKAYYMAFAREKYCSYKYTTNSLGDNDQVYIELHSDGGIPFEQSYIIAKKGEKVFDLLPKDSEESNEYEFLGWFTEKDGGEQITEDTLAPKKDTTYYAHWAGIETYTIQYNLNGGSMTGQKTEYTIRTETFTLPEPSKDGYSFRGWTGSNGTTPQTSVTIPKGSRGNRNYTANWEANTYTVTYNKNATDATGTMTNGTATFDANFTPATNGFTRTGYTFNGWNTEADGSGTAWTAGTAQKYTIPENITLYAQWTANTYTVAFDNNGGTGGQSTSVTATYGSAMPTISTTAPTKTGYTFGGWYDTSAATGGNQYYTASGSSARTYDKTSGTTLYARWTSAHWYIGTTTKTYYVTLADAVSAASAGDTIYAYDTNTDESTVSINKNLTINTNGQTITRKASITTTSGTLTISGSGTITNTTVNSSVLTANGGDISITGGTIKSTASGCEGVTVNASKLSTSGSPLIQTEYIGIHTTNANSILDLQGGYINSTAAHAVCMQKFSSATIKNTYLFTPVRAYNCLSIYGNTTGNVTISGNSKIGNGSITTPGHGYDSSNTDRVTAFYIGTSGEVDIEDNATIYAGPYSGAAVGIRARATIEFKGNSSFYACNGNGVNGNDANAVGAHITFNSGGYFYASGNYVCTFGTRNGTITPTKGHFASTDENSRFKTNGSELSGYAGTLVSGNTTFYYMNAYNSTTPKAISGCYIYNKGV